jgi:hypothetical protein
MKFKKTSPNENFPHLRFVSEEGKWEGGLIPMLFGVRVRLARIGAFGPAIDYCAGADEGDMLTLLAVVLNILKELPEKTTEREMKNYLPEQRIRPMFNDPECWAKLRDLAPEPWAKALTLSRKPEPIIE